MGEVYHEFLIKSRKTATDILLRVLMILLLITDILSMVKFGIIAFIIGVAIAYLTRYVWQATNKEYEYMYLMGEVKIDRISGKIRRKGCGKIELEKTEIVAPLGSDEIKPFEKETYKLRNFTSREKDARIYVAFVRNDSGLIKVLFEPNDDILEAMQAFAPRKVIIPR